MLTNLPVHQGIEIDVVHEPRAAGVSCSGAQFDPRVIEALVEIGDQAQPQAQLLLPAA